MFDVWFSDTCVAHVLQLTTWAHPSAYYNPEVAGLGATVPASMYNHPTHADPSVAIHMDRRASFASSISDDVIHPDHVAFQNKISHLQNKHASRNTGHRYRAPVH
jgi:hypothetical protein